MSNLKNAINFGHSLDSDDFEATYSLLSKTCKYIIDKTVILGPDAICDSYKQNMLEGRKKLENLEWGKSRVEKITDSDYFIHFTDYLTHEGIKYTHRCTQKINFNLKSKISRIEHIEDPLETKRLNKFYKNVGLK